jgi:hypothetical protein
MREKKSKESVFTVVIFGKENGYLLAVVYKHGKMLTKVGIGSDEWYSEEFRELVGKSTIRKIITAAFTHVHTLDCRMTAILVEEYGEGNKEGETPTGE